jgi:hypothetical protein
MLVIPDVQDVYTPLQTDVVVQLSEVSLNCEIFSFCGFCGFVNPLLFLINFLLIKKKKKICQFNEFPNTIFYICLFFIFSADNI